MSQIERRFIVQDILNPPAPHWQGRRHLLQGYWDSPDSDILRVRVTDDTDAEIVRKIGTGVARESDVHRCDIETGMWLYRNCPHRVEKHRIRTDDGWKIDIFTRPNGLIVIEKELASAEEEVVVPAWAVGAVEITETVNNLHIAKLASLHAEGRFPTEHLTRRIPRIVLTGGPCSGKSTVMAAAIEELGDRLHCVPETATIVISLVGAKPPGPQADFLRFQQGIYRVQHEFEALSEQQAVADGKRALLMDRGTADGGAYVEGGRDRLFETCRTYPEPELLRYDAVIMVDVPPRDVYEANAANNPARSETWDEAIALERRIRDAWRGHPNFHLVTDTLDMAYKTEKALEIIRRILR